MVYNRMWFKKDTYGLTIGGGQINNPGRYLVLVPPINGETAPSAAINAPYFTGNPGDPFKAWDSSLTFDYMPRQWITFRWEYDYRHASVPYWTGRGGITPPGSGECLIPITDIPSTLPATTEIRPCRRASAARKPPAERRAARYGSRICAKDESIVDIDILVKF